MISCIMYLESDLGKKLREETALAAALQTSQLPVALFFLFYFKCCGTGLLFFHLSVPSLSGLLRLQVKTSFFLGSMA